MDVESIKQLAIDVNRIAVASFQSGKEHIEQPLLAKIEKLEAEVRELKEALETIEIMYNALKPVNAHLEAEVERLQEALDYAKHFIDCYGAARVKENLGRAGIDAVLKEIDKIIGTDICPICCEEKPVDDLHRNCGK